MESRLPKEIKIDENLQKGWTERQRNPNHLEKLRKRHGFIPPKGDLGPKGTPPNEPAEEGSLAKTERQDLAGVLKSKRQKLLQETKEYVEQYALKPWHKQESLKPFLKVCNDLGAEIQEIYSHIGELLKMPQNLDKHALRTELEDAAQKYTILCTNLTGETERLANESQESMMRILNTKKYENINFYAKKKEVKEIVENQQYPIKMHLSNAGRILNEYKQIFTDIQDSLTQ